MAKIKASKHTFWNYYIYTSPSTTLFCYKKTTTTERMPLCDLDPPFFAKNNKKKKEILLALLCTEEYCFKKNIQW